jgi:Mg2+-importing ATPase
MTKNKNVPPSKSKLISSDISTFWSQPISVVEKQLETNQVRGLSNKVAQSLVNQKTKQQHHHIAPSWLSLLAEQFTSPIIIILLIATVISMILGDKVDGAIIIVIILASGLLSFFQNYRAHREVAALLRRVQVFVTVIRSGEQQRVPVAHVVPGDIFLLKAGDVIPADARLITSEDLLVDESALTGESFPVEKNAKTVVGAEANLNERLNSVYRGTHVVSGEGRAMAVSTDNETEFGKISQALRESAPSTTFSRGMTDFGFMLFRIMIFLTFFIFAVNAFLKRDLISSLLFALSLAVGLTPQMLPAIVTLSLSAGARLMARKKVIVKQLESIENLGSLTVLATDKTGTITKGMAELMHVQNLDGQDDETIKRYSVINAGLQTGFANNPLDQAILKHNILPKEVKLINDIPYDFSRKRLSVLVQDGNQRLLITKGAFEPLLQVCGTAVVGRVKQPINKVRAELIKRYEMLCQQGLRVIGIASKDYDDNTIDVTREDEVGLTLIGLLTFSDPIKPGVEEELAHLKQRGVSVRIITGDNKLTAAAIAQKVGLNTDRIVTGAQIDACNDVALLQLVKKTSIFAEVEPMHKRRIILALHRSGECVGYLGDGINDSPALHAADVGISVNTAVDVAKEAANVVLLNKSLASVDDGITLGRQTFANTLKYVRVTISANFGNMISMSFASLVLPFLPLLPRQILLLNFLTDMPSTTIASDKVDEEQLIKPGVWDIRGIKRFMIAFGALSTVFDLLTFAILWFCFRSSAIQFQSAWFVESTLTELAVLFSLRTARPLWQSRPSRLLVWISAAIAVIVMACPYIPVVSTALGLAALSWQLVIALLMVTVVYVLANEILKRRFNNGNF